MTERIQPKLVNMTKNSHRRTLTLGHVRKNIIHYDNDEPKRVNMTENNLKLQKSFGNLKELTGFYLTCYFKGCPKLE